jgi:hypothetical protein
MKRKQGNFLAKWLCNNIDEIFINLLSEKKRHKSNEIFHLNIIISQAEKTEL